MNSEETKQRIAHLEALRSQIRRWRTVTALLIIAIVVVCVMTIIGSIRGLFLEGPSQKEFTTELVSGLTNNVLPLAQDIAKTAVNELTPVIQDELKKLNTRTPELMEALQKEAESLIANLPEKSQKILNTTLTNEIKRRESKIKKMFPNLTDEKADVLVDNLVEQGGTHLFALVDEVFKPHEEAIDGIVHNLYLIQDLEAAKIKDETPTWDMAILLFDLVKEDLEDLESFEYGESMRQTVSEMIK